MRRAPRRRLSGRQKVLGVKWLGLGVNTYGDKLVLKERGASNGRDGLALSTTRTDMRRERAVRGALLPHLNESKDKSDR